MAKRQRLINIHSSVLNKQPLPEALSVGELAVNNYAGSEFISTLNTENKVVRFSNDLKQVERMEDKEVFPYEGEVGNVDLVRNRSSIKIKLNQLAAAKMPHYDSVNGAVDIDGQEVNPDGAGFAIDTSAFVLNGSNPSFDTLTVNCETNLKGTTNIGGADNPDCGSDLHVNVENLDATVLNTTYGGNTIAVNIPDETINACNKFNVKSDAITLEECGNNGSITIKEKTATVSGTTLEVVEGTSITEKAPTITLSGATINETASGDINSEANNICNKAATKMAVYGGTKTDIGVACDGSVTPSMDVKATNLVVSGGTITYYRNASPSISANTVDGALEEIMNRSSISMTSSAGTASSDLLMRYTFMQNGNQIGTIDIPKDFLLKDAAVVKGTWNGTAFTENASCSGPSCSYALKLVWNVKDPATGHADYKTTYVDVNDFVKDLAADNSKADNGVNLAVWYDGEKNNISADTTVVVNNVTATKSNGTHRVNIGGADVKLSGYTQTGNINSGMTVNGAINALDTKKLDNSGIKKLTVTSGETTLGEYAVTGDVTVKVASDVKHLKRSVLAVNYGSVTGASNTSYDPGAGTVNTNRTGTTITIPKSTSDLNRGTLSWSGGTPTAGNYDTTTNKAIVIPTKIEHLDGGVITNNSGCLSIDKDVCINGNVTATHVYSSSDERIKENIQDVEPYFLDFASNVRIKSFNFKDDKEKGLTVGVIAQDVERQGLNFCVVEGEDGIKKVDYTSLMLMKIEFLQKELDKALKRIKQLEEKQ